MHGLMRGFEELDKVEILWHWRETSQLTENTNVNLSPANLILLYKLSFNFVHLLTKTLDGFSTLHFALPTLGGFHGNTRHRHRHNQSEISSNR